MGNEQGKQNKKGEKMIRQVPLNKQQVEILTLKVKGHIEILRDKRVH